MTRKEIGECVRYQQESKRHSYWSKRVLAEQIDDRCAFEVFIDWVYGKFLCLIYKNPFKTK